MRQPGAFRRRFQWRTQHSPTSAAPGKELIQADRNYIWADPDTQVELDVDVQEERLRRGLFTEAGLARDELIAEALADEGRLLEDEPLPDWAARLREHLGVGTAGKTRLALAHNQANRIGRSSPSEVVAAWEACLIHDPTSEEATSALMRLHSAQGKPALVDSAYQRCRAALEGLGLRTSPALEEVREATNGLAPFSARQNAPPTEMPIELRPVRLREERRLVSVFFAEVSTPAGFQGIDLEDLRDMVGMFVSQLIAEVERLGGTVTSVSGAGLSALFGAPVSHEDDPNKALSGPPIAPCTAGRGAWRRCACRWDRDRGHRRTYRGPRGITAQSVKLSVPPPLFGRWQSPDRRSSAPQHAPPRRGSLSGGGRRTKWRQTSLASHWLLHTSSGRDGATLVGVANGGSLVTLAW